MRVVKTRNAALVCALLLAGGAALAGNGHGNAGHAKGKPGRASGELTPPEGAADQDAFAKIDVKHVPAVGKRPERSWLRVKLRRLDANASYTLWIDDPSTPADPSVVQVGTEALVTNDDGAANIFFDTKKTGALPFSATLADLGGKSVEIHDSNGAVVLAATVPAIQ